ncbi:hypothetical protein HDK90DRAFT_89381 [Phyllosticta capitalensis]|uniref:Uncharacterized protein n=1 Tax=Phyllosticta capitalensis TaxID=121624 RepID=A0ABR1YB84_9PEZI
MAYCRVSLSTAPPIPAGPPLRRASYLEWRDRGTSTSTSTATPPVPAPPNVRLSSPFASERRTGSVENRLLALPCCALLCGGSMVVSEKGLWIWAIVVTKTSKFTLSAEKQSTDFPHANLQGARSHKVTSTRHDTTRRPSLHESLGILEIKGEQKMEWLGICRSISSCSPCTIIMGRTNAPRADPRVHHLLPLYAATAATAVAVAAGERGKRKNFINRSILHAGPLPFVSFRLGSFPRGYYSGRQKRAWAGLSLVTCPDVFNQVNTQEKEARVSQPGKREHHVSAA